MTLINVHQLEKAFGAQTLFKNVSFGLEESEHVGLVGPNGAGKSTLLRILYGIADSDAGRISRKKGLRMGFLEQTPRFTSGRSIFDSILEKCEDPHESMGRAYEIMAHLQLKQFSETQPIDELSGGWQKRVALARELILEPELLLLDEPTNHLDVTGIIWLENYLKSASFSYLMITHDRLFLQRTVNRILDLDPRNPQAILSVTGDYATYAEIKEQELAAQKRHERVQRNTLRRETEWLRRGSIARQTKQSARIQNAAELKDNVEELTRKNQKKVAELEFGGGGHAPKKLIEAKNLKKSYDDKFLFENLNLLISPKTRLALLGDNGCGKSTLVKILLNQVEPDQGTVTQADGLKIAYFEQSKENLDRKASVLKNLCPEGDYVNFNGQFVHVRSYLDRFLFFGRKAELPVEKLSGGEQARLRLAQLMLIPSQMLILDEPTNDLDAETLEVLEQSLNDFNGAVILVTHDRYFMDAVANQILAFPPEHFPKRDLQTFASYFQWENWYEQESASADKSNSQSASEQKSAASKARMSFKEKFELENMEAVILKLETELENLTAESLNPNTLNDPKKMTETHIKLAELQDELDNKYQRWAELENKSK